MSKNHDEIKKSAGQLSELKKHVAAVHIRNKLSLLQHKIANILLLFAYDDLLTKEEHRIRIGQLARLAGFSSNDYDLLKQSLVVLTETSLQWNLLEDGGKKGEWGVSTMLAQAVIDKNECRYAYSPELRRKLYNPEIYARINLAVQQTFTSGYALKLYENCVRYRDVCSTGWWSIPVFKSLLGLEAHEYADFKDLNKWVIKPSVAQVNANSDIILEVEYKRQQRRIVELRFQVQDNPQLILRLSIRKQLLSQAGEGETEELPVAEPEEGAGPSVRERLRQFGLTERETQAVMARYDEQYVLENLVVIEQTYLAGKVETLPAFTKAALKADYRPRRSPLEAAELANRQDKNAGLARQQQARQLLETLHTRFEQQRLQRALGGLSAEQQSRLRDEFQEACRTQPLFKRWLSKGWDSPVVQGMFHNFAARQLLAGDGEAEFGAFVKAEGHDLEQLRAEAAA